MFKRRKQHKIALQIAREYNMEYDYLTAREYGYPPIEALEEFDLPTHALTQNKVSGKRRSMMP